MRFGRSVAVTWGFENIGRSVGVRERGPAGAHTGPVITECEVRGEAERSLPLAGRLVGDRPAFRSKEEARDLAGQEKEERWSRHVVKMSTSF